MPAVSCTVLMYALVTVVAQYCMYARVFIMAQYCMYCTRTHIRTVLLHVPVLTLGQSYIYPFSYIHILVHMVMTASVNIKQRVSHVGTGDWGPAPCRAALQYSYTSSVPACSVFSLPTYQLGNQVRHIPYALTCYSLLPMSTIHQASWCAPGYVVCNT